MGRNCVALVLPNLKYAGIVKAAAEAPHKQAQKQREDACENIRLGHMQNVSKVPGKNIQRANCHSQHLEGNPKRDTGTCHGNHRNIPAKHHVAAG